MKKWTHIQMGNHQTDVRIDPQRTYLHVHREREGVADRKEVKKEMTSLSK